MSRELKASGIRAVLTGGACASIHSGGEYQSEDLDLILQGAPSQRALDDAMKRIGFKRHGDHYVHPKTDFFVEFPHGPLAIGDDLSVRPIEVRIGSAKVLALSATDSCRDRLAAFFHWSDRQSLETAVAIAVRNRVNLKKIRAWSAEQGSAERFEEFLRELDTAKRARRRR